MKFPLFSRLAMTMAVGLAAAPVVFGQDTTPPVVNKAIADVTVSAGSAPTNISLKKTFRLSGVTGETVRFTTTEGTIDVELFSDKTPVTVATFLKYAADTSSDHFGYTQTLIQRAIKSFIVQGGGFYVMDGQFTSIPSVPNDPAGRPTIPSEAGISNTAGTLAMALSTGPDSATGDWFFNVVSNNTLTDPAGVNLDDSSDGGPFTVFGRVLGVLPDPARTTDLTTLDKIEALPRMKNQDGSLSDVPVTNDTNPTLNDFVYTNTIAPISLIPKKPGAASVLRLKVKNNNHSLVTAKVSGRKLVLTYTPGQTGTATIKLRATDRTTGSKVLTSFKVTVQ